MGIDTIPPKIVIMLKDNINYSMQSFSNMMMIVPYSSTFPDQGKSHQLLQHLRKMKKSTKRITGRAVLSFQNNRNINFRTDGGLL